MPYIRRIKAEIIVKPESLQPSYQTFMKTHVDKLMALQDKEGKPLISRVVSRKDSESQVFVTDLTFETEEHYRFYTEKYLNQMRQDIMNTYDPCPLMYKFALSWENPKEFDALLSDAGSLDTFIELTNDALKNFLSELQKKNGLRFYADACRAFSIALAS